MNRHVIAVMLCVLALALAPFGAQAQSAPDRQRWQQLSPAERERLMRSRNDNRDNRDNPDKREDRGGQQDRRTMSPDERQQLRRDISDHGREIYGGQSGGNRSGRGPGRPQRR